LQAINQGLFDLDSPSHLRLEFFETLGREFSLPVRLSFRGPHYHLGTVLLFAFSVVGPSVVLFWLVP
jgi:hypothetical protein